MFTVYGDKSIDIVNKDVSYLVAMLWRNREITRDDNLEFQIETVDF